MYTIEAILKIVALRKEYFRSPWNLFDLAIVIASFLDLLLESVTSISGFRVLRLVSKDIRHIMKDKIIVYRLLFSCIDENF